SARRRARRRDRQSRGILDLRSAHRRGADGAPRGGAFDWWIGRAASEVPPSLVLVGTRPCVSPEPAWEQVRGGTRGRSQIMSLTRSAASMVEADDDRAFRLRHDLRDGRRFTAMIRGLSLAVIALGFIARVAARARLRTAFSRAKAKGVLPMLSAASGRLSPGSRMRRLVLVAWISASACISVPARYQAPVTRYRPVTARTIAIEGFTVGSLEPTRYNKTT